MEDEARDLDWLRRQLVIALASDDELFELLILKGGNALALAHGIGMRASLDLDYSLAREAEDDDILGDKLLTALRDQLARKGLTLFDWKFGARPRNPRDERALIWGGYQAEFKVIESKVWNALAGDLDQARNRAWGITPGGGASRRFRVELSRSEYCEGAGEEEVGEGIAVRVYTPAMIAAEKLRSLCQQMTEYKHSSKRKARARDFFDIYSIVTVAGVNLSSDTNKLLLSAVFGAKDVPLGLLAHLKEECSFHEAEWPAVRDAIPADQPSDFEFYADFVLTLVRKLKPLWVEDAP